MCLCVCDKSKLSSLESAQDAGGWPAVFCLAAKGYHGLASQFENYRINIFLMIYT